MFNEEFEKIKHVIEDTSQITLEDEYDALLVKKMSSSNLIGRRENTNQSHIALTGKETTDMFPYVDIYHYTHGNPRNLLMKSFYVLQVPISIHQKNISYFADGSSLDVFNFDQNEILVTDVSIKQSVRGDNSRQLEFGNTTTSSPMFQEFRRLIHENDFLILLKRKNKLEYDAFIVKSSDAETHQLNSVTYLSQNSRNSTIVDIASYKLEEAENSNNLIPGENIIFYGAPGTGKSYEITRRVKEIYPDFEDEESEDSKFVFRTTFHPEYTYSDFVGQILPNVEEDKIDYQFSQGVFTRALIQALKHENSNIVFLILEELSRANVSAIFGDLFQLLDRKNGRSEYSISNPIIAKEIYPDDVDKKIYLPKNLFIFASVNTNDQNVFVMDTAFKRRFDWEYISTKPVLDENGQKLNNPIIQIDNIQIQWCDFYQKLNLYITNVLELSEDKQVGQFFIQFPEPNADTPNDNNQNKLRNKLLQYLWSDVEKAIFNNKKLFNNINSFSELYENFKDNKKVFVDDFLSSFDDNGQDMEDTDEN